MKQNISKKRQKGIAERKTTSKRTWIIPYKAIGLGLFFWLLATWLFFGQGSTPTLTETIGERVRATIQAKVDFECENLRETTLARAEKQKNVPPVFTMSSRPLQAALNKTERIFGQLEQYIAADETQKNSHLSTLDGLLQGAEINIRSSELIDAFPSNTVASINQQLLNDLTKVMQTGILSDENRETLAGNLLSIDEKPDVELNKIYTPNSAISQLIAPYKDQQQRLAIEKIMSSLVTKNLSYSEGLTEKKRQKIAKTVPPVINLYTAGQILVTAGEQVTEQTELLLKTHAQAITDQRDVTEQMSELLGNTLLLLLGLIITTAMLRIGAPKTLKKLDHLLLFILLASTSILLARLITYLSVSRSLLPPTTIIYLIPQALAVMLSAILLGAGSAICLGFCTSFATAILLEHSFSAFALGMLTTITATSATHNIHRRTNLFRAALWVCLAKSLFVLLSALQEHPHLSVVINQLTSAISAGVVSAILTLLLIPVFEKLFKITTDITLLELSDMGHPLLQKMAMQAPGTYHHSLMVATLAQNAAEAIGANALLARVCAYYHDIGKMAKPEFFTENIQHKENPHDELSPHMSALVISSHVKEGLALAKRHKLPQPILDAIEQHHGNGLISFFFHKAKKQSGETGDVINESDFRYGGAPAVTPEMSILSLADASEAASRSIEKPTPQKIANLLDDIFNAKIRDGQLDYASLTMAQIKAVKQSFIFSLSNMLHGRIPYPKDHDNKHSKPTEKASDSTPKD